VDLQERSPKIRDAVAEQVDALAACDARRPIQLTVAIADSRVVGAVVRTLACSGPGTDYKKRHGWEQCARRIVESWTFPTRDHLPLVDIATFAVTPKS